MGLSYIGISCLLTDLVIGYRRVPEPPANIIPFMRYSCLYFKPGNWWINFPNMAFAVVGGLISILQSTAFSLIT